MGPVFETLKLTHYDNGILLVTLNRPDVLNAINYQMMRELRDFWGEASQNKALRCIVLTGSGEKAFCAGADLKERRNLDLTVWKQQHVALEEAMLRLSDCPIPVIAAVNGIAYGGGLELMLACDFAYAASTATFAQSETRLGLIPGAMGTQNLPKACGLRRAKELCFTARAFNAEEAYQWGLVNQLCQPSELLPQVLEVANSIASNAPIAVQQAKQAMNYSQASELKQGFAFEITAYNRILLTADREEGIRAFNEKRKAKFIGK